MEDIIQISEEEMEALVEIIQRQQADINYLLARAMKAGSVVFTEDRDTGVSSNSLVRLAYDPSSAIAMPSDMSDLRACEKAYHGMPEHRKTTEVHTALERQRAAVASEFMTVPG